MEVVFGLHSVRTAQPGMEPRAQESSLCYCASEAGCRTPLRYSQEPLHSSLAYVSKHLEQLKKKTSVFPLCTQVTMLQAMISVCVKENELVTGHNWYLLLNTALELLLVLNFHFLWHSIWCCFFLACPEDLEEDKGQWEGLIINNCQS